MKSAIIISASSDIGTSLSKHWLQNMQIFGTYRTYSQHVANLQTEGMKLVHCDLSKRHSVLSACTALRDLCPRWDVLVLCPGLQDPIGPFVDTEFSLWEESIMVNFIGQLRIVRELLPYRRLDGPSEPLVLMFAGGGPNKATVNYSAYAASKVALIKMCELLDAEMNDTRFIIVNPGWVKTKAHEAMLRAGLKAGEDYVRTVEKFNTNDWTPMEDVVQCCDWALEAPRSLVGGRYLGVSFDQWGSEAFKQRLLKDTNLCKLRRRECLSSEHSSQGTPELTLVGSGEAISGKK